MRSRRENLPDYGGAELSRQGTIFAIAAIAAALAIAILAGP